MNMVNPLLTILHPRHIPQVVESLNTIDTYDKLWVGRYRFYHATRYILKFFIKHREYTHIVLIADDMVFPRHYIDTLVRDIVFNPQIEVIGCPINVDISDKGLTNYGLSMFDIPAKDRNLRVYNWLPMKFAPQTGIHPVAHQGAALQFISRRLIENKTVTLLNDLMSPIVKYENKDYLEIVERPEIHGCCEDVVRSHELAEAGIKQYVDFSLPIKHLKVKRKHDNKLLVGIEKPFIIFERRISDVKNKK